MKLVMIGCGNMGFAMGHAMLQKQNVLPGDLLVVETNHERRQKIQEEWGCHVIESIGEGLSEYEYIMLAVKPQASLAVMEKLSLVFKPYQVVISIMAGVSVGTMNSALSTSKLVRVMPNTPAQIGEGMSAYYIASELEERQESDIEAMLGALGGVLRVEEEDGIDAATAVSGSGPGYLFSIAEQMVIAAMSLGFSESDAATLVQQTFRGSSLLWEQQSLSASELKKRVTSKGGTTQAALDVFEQQGLYDALNQGIERAYRRSKELSS